MENKKSFGVFYVLLVSIIFTLHSCNSKVEKREMVKDKTSDKVVEVEVEKEKEKSADENIISKAKSSFNFGKWRLDSVAENNIVKSRLIKDSKIQIFNFRQDGIFSAMEVSGATTKDRPLGNWKIKDDTVYIFNETGKGMMRYKYTNLGKMLVLNGNFQISPKNPNKPTFYLSKYK